MLFRARFMCSEEGELVIAKPGFVPGLNHLQKVRELSGCPEFPKEKVCENVSPCMKNVYTCFVSESLAIKSNLFNETGCRDILVPPRFLNRFVSLEYEQLLGIYDILWVIDNKAIIKAWEAAGFPLYWKEEE